MYVSRVDRLAIRLAAPSEVTRVRRSNALGVSCLAWLLWCFAAGLVPAAASAATDTWAVDTSYGVGGQRALATPIVGSIKSVRDGFLLPTGAGLLAGAQRVVGGASVVQLSGDGTPTAAFRLRDDLKPWGLGIIGRPVAKDSQGRLWLEGAPMGMVRILPDGTRDRSFEFLKGLGAAFEGGYRKPFAYSLDGEDRLVVASAKVLSERTFVDGRVQRVLASGGPDRSFGVEGVLRPGFVPSCVVAGAGGRVLVASRSALHGYTADGQVDRSYGTNGKVILPASAGTLGLDVNDGERSTVRCVSLPSGAVNVFTSAAMGKRQYVTQVDPSGRQLTQSRRLGGEPTTVTVFPDSAVAIASIFSQLGADQYGLYSAQVQAFDASLRAQPRFAGRSDVRVNVIAPLLTTSAAVLPNGDLLAAVRTTRRTTQVARVRLGRATQRQDPPRGLAKPRLALHGIQAYAGGPVKSRRQGAYPIVKVAYRCAPECALASMRWRYERLSAPRRSIFQSAPTLIAASATPVPLHPTLNLPLRPFLGAGKYRLTVNATDAFGRTASLRKSFTIRCGSTRFGWQCSAR